MILSNNNNATKEVGIIADSNILSGMSPSNKKVKGASKSNDDTLEQNMSTADDNASICANCGKEGASNSCNKCKMVKYCNAACKKKHRHKHKTKCEERLRRVAEEEKKKHDEILFKQPPPQFDDCPICFLRMPTLETGYIYYSCCGKTICGGCDYAVTKIAKEEKCPFCRTPHPTCEVK